MNWEPHAEALAWQLPRNSGWWAIVATTPRHHFVPRWWQRADDGWELHDGPSDPDRWLEAAYRDASLVTRVGPLHADLADAADRPSGRPTSSATLPSLMVRMYEHARLDGSEQLLDIGTGSGYGTALATRLLDSEQVVSVDVDHHLVDSARDRLGELGLTPCLDTVDASGTLPYRPHEFDVLVASVSVSPIPADWLRVLCPGGRLIATLAGTSLIVSATKQAHGGAGATGRVLWDRAGFMPARHGQDYTPALAALLDTASTLDGDEVTTGPYPVVDVANAWDLDSMLSLTAPGIEHEYREDPDGDRTALMAHADGSWARATAHGTDRPTVHQGGPRRLWDLLDECRTYWLTHGELPVRGASVFIKPDGTTTLARGDWHTTITPEPAHP